MSFVDENVSLSYSVEPRADTDLPIGQTLRAQTADGLKAAPYLASTIPFTQADVDALATAMRKGGSWFYGRDVRSLEQAKLAARDVLVSADVIGYMVVPKLTAREVNEEEEVSPFPEESTGVTGQAGNSR